MKMSKEEKKGGKAIVPWKVQFPAKVQFFFFVYVSLLWNHKNIVTKYVHEKMATRKQIEQSINWFDYYVESLMCTDSPISLYWINSNSKGKSNDRFIYALKIDETTTTKYKVVCPQYTLTVCFSPFLFFFLVDFTWLIHWLIVRKYIYIYILSYDHC